ncbi:LysM domain-containing protein [Venturia nashicola]|uniref:LysM domain-containing protein n=1 Tax=Venturia nashicola TaxID=86259 RepID=A0A4Z1NZE7_9PEZI|nr:LysM domain-containing protein [Venturia nashicola]TLD32015.1 LysM domain-containing protein [Venturia nashicola]
MSTTRYSRLDSDDERLPENMTRIGYDADTQRYQYQDSTDGSYWEGPPGSQYGILRPVGWVDPRSDEERLLASREHEAELERQEKEAWRMLMPFFLLCGVFILGVWWIVGGKDFWKENATGCLKEQVELRVKAGDTCWGITGGTKEVLQQMKRLNKGVNCGKLRVGDLICLPGGGR